MTQSNHPYDDQNEQAPREECGVFGVWAPGEEVAKLTYFGLFALQHRGQEAAGIAVGDGEKILVFKDLGLVSQVFDEPILESLHGNIAIGHTRYTTAGGNSWENAQPMFRMAPDGTDVALGHNGNLINHVQLRDKATELGLVDPVKKPSDTDVLTALLANGIGDGQDLFDSAQKLLPEVKGAYCLTFTDGHTLYAARDPYGIRPLSIGRLARGWVVASETSALDIVGASLVREVEPGELIAIDESGLRSTRFAETTRKGCIFEYVYLARPDSVIKGRSVNEVRLEIGRKLAREAPAEGDLVIPTPDSGTPAAVGFAQASGIPFGQGMVKNAYVGRTFIQPSDTLRQLGIRLKLNPLREVIAGKRLVVVDDSIVRGNTQRAVIRMLREAGAAEVHVRIASPPVKWPCFYGIDFATPGELIANAVTSDNEEQMVEAVRSALGADSLAYVSIEGMVESTAQPVEEMCLACFSGDYPMGMPEANANAELVLKMQAARQDKIEN